MSSKFSRYHANNQIPERKQTLSVQTLLLLASCSASFYMGLMIGISMSHTVLLDCQATKSRKGMPVAAGAGTSNIFSAVAGMITSEKRLRFDTPMAKLIAGAARVNRDEFFQQFDLGVPLDHSSPGNQEALILYHHENSIPNVSTHESVWDATTLMPLLTVQDATVNCDTLKVILTEANRPRQCTAIVGQWESYYIHKYMRLPPDNIRTGVNASLPLRNVARTYSANKGRTQIIPRNFLVEHYDFKILVPYLSNLKRVLNQLRPIAKRVALSARKMNTIVVMVCNFGQSELLINFICSARARGCDLSNVLVFCTDIETKRIVDALGVASFHDEVIFERMSEEAAGKYGDSKFAGMMMAKIFCVHLISQLGINVLFQDVDVVWYRNPMDYFHQKREEDDFDLYFQDDGAHSIRYAPFSANTGFYYVRANDRTRYLFHCFLKLGDMIAQSGSHQAVLTGLLNEHSSYRGLRIKVFARDTIPNEFPGGYHYHRDKPFMKQMIAKEVKPCIFHMSWTNNKENKRKFFQQMGDWYVQPKCLGKKAFPNASTVDDAASMAVSVDSGEVYVSQDCCVVEPLVECHFKDKPSIIPCRSKPPVDKHARSWW